MTATQGRAPRITVEPNGPYIVEGSVPLVRKTQIVSEYGEPLTWRKGETLSTGKTYLLCRCGQSKNRPFCDDSHLQASFDGTETAPTNSTAERQEIHPGGRHLIVKRDNTICAEAGFCGTRLTNIRKMMKDADEPAVRAAIIAMVERCPSGSYTYAIEPGEPDVEPDLPVQIAATVEITDEGPIDGPLWVTGGIPVQRADGRPFETRQRVTLCNCGHSNIKPLCDGTHRTLKERLIRSAAGE